MTIVITLVLGSFGGQFQPAEDQNESFAPEAPELTASAEIAEPFGAVSRMQVLTSSDTGDVITLGCTACGESRSKNRCGAARQPQCLVDTPQSPAILSHLAPVQFAIEAGAPVPTNDAEVKALYRAGLEQVPPEFRTFLTALLSDDADSATSNRRAWPDAPSPTQASDDFDEAAARATVDRHGRCCDRRPRLDHARALQRRADLRLGRRLPGRGPPLFLAAAALIILLVLAIIFLVRPSTVRDRVLFVAGMALMAHRCRRCRCARPGAALPRHLPRVVG